MAAADPIEAVLQAHVDAGELAGAATLVWRNGRVAQTCAVGWRDLEGRLPVGRDTLFRIASMSKPVTCAVALSLWDEGAFELEEPIAERWAPEFAHMRVLRDPEGPLDATDPAERPITFLDLFTHRAGLTYGGFHSGPIRQAQAQALGADIDSHRTPDEWIAALARLPLVDQPGAAFRYGYATDLLGLLAARMAGTSLGELMRQRLFEPLGMKDTGFTVPPEKRRRRAVMYGFDADGRLQRRPSTEAFLEERPAEIRFESGGAGLWSTLDDYLAFARLFVEDGAVGGRRILKVSTVRRMMGNHLTDAQRAAGTMLGMPAFAGHGFGLGLAVVMDPAKAQTVRCNGGVGTVGWPGAFGGWWQADPTDGSVMIFLAHNALDPELIARGVGLGVYAAITEFHALASELG